MGSSSFSDFDLIVDDQFDLVDNKYGHGDGGKLSLREALAVSKSRPGADMITFDTAIFSTKQTIVLDHILGELLIDDTDVVKIIGPGADLLTIDADRDSAAVFMEHRVLRVEPGSNVSMSGVTLTGGVPTSYNLSVPWARQGGGVLNLGSLSLHSINVINNETGTRGSGGGIYNNGQIEIVNSTISGNRAGENGGGGIFAAGNVTIRDSSIVNNSADYIQQWGDGGGIAVGWLATVDIYNSTISGNSASGSGGGVSDGFYGGEGGAGGGSVVTFTNTTITDNTGGGIYLNPNFTPPSSWTFHNNIISGNHAFIAWDVQGASSIDSSSSYNIVGIDLTNTFNVSQNNFLGVDPLLAPLADNGGPTQTHALLVGSLALDAGDNSLLPPTMDYDQRGIGFTRIYDGQVDIGAIEANAYTAEIIFVVDESPSMATEQMWLPNQAVSSKLEAELEKLGIIAPRFGLVRYAGVTSNLPQQVLIGGNYLGTAEEFTTASSSLTALGGGREDSYRAIMYALDETIYPLRAKAPVNIILVTDEDRDVWADISGTGADNLAFLLGELANHNAILNVVVGLTFDGAPGNPPNVLGVVDEFGTYLLPFGVGEFTTHTDVTCTTCFTHSGPINQDGSADHSYVDYADLAWDSGGAVWDIGILSNGTSNLLNSFTGAIAEIKAEEIAAPGVILNEESRFLTDFKRSFDLVAAGQALEITSDLLI